MMAGLILIIIGLTFLLKNLGYISGGAWSIIWPAILIVVGIGILLKRRDRGFFLARQNFWWPSWCPRDNKESEEKQR